MRARALLFGIHARPPRWLQWVYIVVPLLIVLAAYEYYSLAYLADNPRGKLLPSFTMMVQRFWVLAHVDHVDIKWAWIWEYIPVPDITLAGQVLWSDTAVSLARLFAGLVIASVIGLFLGLNIALFPSLQYWVLPWIVALSFVPVVAVLPILLIVFGIGEEAKVMLIFLGLMFIITRDIYARAGEVAPELLIKARTIGATELGLTYRIVLPMIMPSLFDSIRLNLGTAWFCLMMGEAIAAQQGLAYRIFLFRRVGPDMAGIIPYVVWITLLAFGIYYVLGCVQRSLYPWKERN